MKIFLRSFSLMLFLLLLPFVSVASGNKIFLREDFNNLDNWTQFTFPSIKSHTKYSIEKDQEGYCLRSDSNASASGILHNRVFSVFDYPYIKWRWKITNVYKKGDARKRSGDDYPVRIQIVFKYDPAKAGFGKKLKYGQARKIHGEYPPHSILNYIWANRKHKAIFFTNTYAGDSRMKILRAGADSANIWIEETVNIIDDYRKAFGEDPPPLASIAIMNDSDNTGESSVSFVDYIEVFGVK